MKQRTEIDIMPLQKSLGPEGDAGQRGSNLGLKEVQGVCIGKHSKLTLEAGSQLEATIKVEGPC